MKRALIGSALVVIACWANSLLAADKPNVIVILIDDMGWADSSTYGSKYYQTPNMTRMAEEGMLFTDAYAASPLCSPTRASIMTGQYPARLRMTVAVTPKSVAEPKALLPAKGKYTGDLQSKSFLPLKAYTLAEALKDEGYQTAHIGKWHLTPGNDDRFSAQYHGFDYVIGGGHLPGPPNYYSPYDRGKPGTGIPNLEPGPEGEYLNKRLAEESIRWMESVKGSGRPFYLNLWHYAVHTPIIPKEDLMPKYRELRDPESDQRCPEMATMIESMDNSVGILLDWLDRPENRELKENTLIVLTSDNGGVTHKAIDGNTITSNRPLRGGKANTYEGGFRVPWIALWPGKIDAATTCTIPVQTTDLYPTILEVTGASPKSGQVVDGQSIVPLLEGRPMEHQPIFTDFPHVFGAMCAPSSAVRVGDWKLIRFHHAGMNAASDAFELFNLKKDPYESIELSRYYPEKVQELDRLIEAHLKSTDALLPIANKDFKGNPMKRRSSPKRAPNRPETLRLEESEIQTDRSGSHRIQLIDQDGRKRDTHAYVLEGADRVEIENEEDGSVLVKWGSPEGKRPAKLLFGWKGGSTTMEVNDWTIPASELTIKEKTDISKDN
ncbi:sulfatase [Pelagicoccus mobilis]|uniref:Sulfatase n=1 Tax=Pelagicoccus mobilis TaxID=415221 RepID=A0A934RZS0_9BACT|nr:sulfatase [Pelagicoccus mobilis]MBK1879641.1 sulfatase [Pelagicoccus mobilis]